MPQAMPHLSGAAAIIIGNEVLSAKVVEANGALLIRRLRERGVPLRLMMVVPDEVDAIVDALSRARAVAAHVFTSGGIGPTHDDITVRSVALALGRKVVRLPEMEALIHEHYGSDATAEAMRLADVPEGAELLYQEGVWYPTLTCNRVYMLPGVPQLFRIQLETVLARIPGAPIVLRCLYLSLGEAQIARVLDEVALAMPHVAIGSYPTFDPNAGYRVKVTLEHAEAEVVDEATARVVAGLPADSILRRE
jgi:molybdopterin-biosynthesis enzyme MoeA-like protein